MPRKPTLTCTTPHGVFTRGTYRKYTHVVVSIHLDGTGTALSWHGSRALALQYVTSWRKEIAKQPMLKGLEIFLVDQEAPLG